MSLLHAVRHIVQFPLARKLLLTAACAVPLLSATVETASAYEVCYPSAADEKRVSTSTRKSYVRVMPCFSITDKTIQPFVKWQNTRGSLGCQVSWPPGCSIDALKPPVDFHPGLWVRLDVDAGGTKLSWKCNINHSSVNAANDYTGTCYSGTKFAGHRKYKIKAVTEFDVKDDGNGWYNVTSGVAERNW